MNLEYWVQKFLSGPSRRGLSLNARAQGTESASPLKWLTNKTKHPPVLPGLLDEIVIVGLGVASLTLTRNLKMLGFKHVTLVGSEEEAGGKCVHFGCMPSEFFFHHRELSPSDRIHQTREFTQTLAQAVAAQFKSFGYPMLEEQVVDIQSQQISFASGRSLGFDKLVLATGNRQKEPEGLPPLSPLRQFWLPQGKTRRILSDSHPGALSLAEVSRHMGLEVELCFSRSLLLGHLPSLGFFREQIEQQGVVIRENVDFSGLADFDEQFFYGHPIPNRPTVNGKNIAKQLVDFQYDCLAEHPDIHVLGDAAGLLSASEAILQAQSLAQQFAGRNGYSAQALPELPFRIHGTYPLAAVGRPETLMSRNWRTLDFASLGHSLVTGESGRLWYLLDQKTRKIRAIHICHPKASELISQAAVLLEYEIDDPRWLMSAVHPSAAEIFHLLVEDAQDQLPVQFAARARASTVECHLPPVERMRSDAFFQQHFSDSELRWAELEAEPDLYLGLLLGLRHAGNLQGKLEWGEEGWRMDSKPIHYDQSGSLLTIRLPHQRVKVLLESSASH